MTGDGGCSKMGKPTLVLMSRHRGQKPAGQKRGVTVFCQIQSRIVDFGPFAFGRHRLIDTIESLKFVALIDEMRAPREGHLETHFDDLLKAGLMVFIVAQRRVVGVINTRVLRHIRVP